MPNLPRLPKKKRTRVRSGNQSFYASVAWKRLTEWFRTTQQPLCQACLYIEQLTDISPGGRRGVTDHIIRMDDGGAKQDVGNLLGLCNKHHNRKSWLEGKGLLIITEEYLNDWGERVPTEESVEHILKQLTNKA